MDSTHAQVSWSQNMPISLIMVLDGNGRGQTVSSSCPFKEWEKGYFKILPEHFPGTKCHNFQC